MDVGIEQLRSQVSAIQADLHDFKSQVSFLEKPQSMCSRGCSTQTMGAQAVPKLASMPKVQVSSVAAPPQPNVVPWSFVASPPHQHRTSKVITPGRQSPTRHSPRLSPRASFAQLPPTPTMQAVQQTMGQPASQLSPQQSTPSTQLRTVSVANEDGSRRSPLPQERRALGLLHQRLAGRVSGIVSVLSQQTSTSKPQVTPHLPGQPKQLQQQNRFQASLRQRQPQQSQQQTQPSSLSTPLPTATPTPVVPPLQLLSDCEPSAVNTKASDSSTPAPATESNRHRSTGGARRGRRHSICIAGSGDADASSDGETGAITSRSAVTVSYV